MSDRGGYDEAVAEIELLRTSRDALREALTRISEGHGPLCCGKGDCGEQIAAFARAALLGDVPSGSARPPVPPQEGYVIAGRCLSTQHNQEPCDCAPSGLGDPAREPTLEEIVTATWFALQVRYGFSGYIDDSLFAWVRARLSSSSEVSRMEPFPLVPIPPHEVERESKAFEEKFTRHEDQDGMEPFDWREYTTLFEAIRLGFLPELDEETWYTFKNRRALTVTDPERPGWEAFRMWALEILNGPSTPEPDPWPVYDAAAYQAERLRRASADE